MIKRYALTLGGFFLLAAIYLLTLLPLQLVRSDLTDQTYLKALTAWGLLVLLSLGPVLSILLKKIWFFHGRGRSVPLKKLRSTLMAVNEMHAPVVLQQRGKRLIAQWRYEDPAWCEQMAAENISRLYELRLGFDENTRTVSLSDYSRRVNLDLCPIRVKIGFFALPRLFFGIKIGKKQGVSKYKKLRPSDFRFKPGEIKSPLVNTILAQGWNVRFTFL